MRPMRHLRIIDAMMHESSDLVEASQLAAHLAPSLALLRAVAAEGHLTRAAQHLGTPQPTVSRSLARLSEELGAPITARRGRGVHLTRAGALLASAADEALRGLEARCREVLEELDPERGRVAFGFQHSMGLSLAPRLIGGFRHQHPDAQFDLAQGPRDEVLERMLRAEIDLCLVSPPPSGDPQVESVPISTEPLVAVLYSGHRLAGRARLRLSELAEEDFVATRPGYGLRQIFTDLTERAGFVPRLAFEGEEMDTVRGLVAAGLGVALLPPGSSGPAPGTAEIALRPNAHRTIGLVWPAQRALPPAVRAFRDFALARAGG